MGTRWPCRLVCVSQWNASTFMTGRGSAALCFPLSLFVCVFRSGTQRAQRGSSLWARLCTEGASAACWCLTSHPRPASAPWRCGGRSSWSRESLRIPKTFPSLSWATRRTWATGRSVSTRLQTSSVVHLLASWVGFYFEVAHWKGLNIRGGVSIPAWCRCWDRYFSFKFPLEICAL